MTRGRQGKAQKEAAAERGTHGATTGYEADLWRMADTLRGSMDAAEYKHVVLGIIFLKIHLRCLRGEARPPRERKGTRC